MEFTTHTGAIVFVPRHSVLFVQRDDASDNKTILVLNQRRGDGMAEILYVIQEYDYVVQCYRLGDWR